VEQEDRMTGSTVDILIVGGGIMGCAAAYQLAKDGQRVLLLEQYHIGNGNGSSHGASRLFRLIHAEMDYIELARAAYRAWRELEAESGEYLMQQVGGLDIGSENSLDRFRKAMQAAEVAFEELNRDEIIRRYPQFVLPPETVGLFQRDYCVLAADRCMTALVAQARRHGAVFLEGQRVLQINASYGSVQVQTDQASYSAGGLILSAGSWMRPLARQLDLELPLTVTKEMVAYFRPKSPEAFMPDRFPLFRQHLAGERARWGVGFPIFNHTDVKMTMDCTGPVVEPDDPDRTVEKAQLDLLRAYVAGILPGLGDHLITAESCRYTMTPDEDFILDRHPAYPQVVVASPCSGHGFKFAVLIGRILADLAQHGATRYEIERFRLTRPALGLHQ
jgi:sarcosine oxidase